MSRTTQTNEPVDIEALKAQLRAEIAAEQHSVDIEAIKAEAKAEVQAELEAKQKEAEEAAAKEEARMERQLAKQEKTMKDILEAQQKKTIHIPENPLNPNEVVPVGVNGVIYAIPVGQDFEVPEAIYDVWKYSYDQTRAANKRMDQVLTKELKIL